VRLLNPTPLPCDPVIHFSDVPCQVGVFAALGKGHLSTLIDERLYLPKEWASSPARRGKAGFLQAARVYQSKSELALEMVRHQRALGLCFAWMAPMGITARNRLFFAVWMR
jgi:DDE superfamily endonuclease